MNVLGLDTATAATVDSQSDDCSLSDAADVRKAGT